jgi:hypothetical protein
MGLQPRRRNFGVSWLIWFVSDGKEKCSGLKPLSFRIFRGLKTPAPSRKADRAHGKTSANKSESSNQSSCILKV